MKKISYFLVAILLIISTLSFQKKAETRPNILIIFSDDHALQAISAYGSPYIKTPNIDRIANEGAIFRNMLCTNSLCAPSRAVLLTGKLSHINGHRDNLSSFNSAQDMFPKRLQEAGYQTSWIGKWHLQNNPHYFDYWTVLPNQGDYYNPDFIEMDSTKKRFEGYATTITADKALNWLDKQRDKSKPFCLVVGQKAPHRNWLPDTTDLHAFDGVKFKIPETYYDNYEGRKAAAKQEMNIYKDMRLAPDLKIDYDVSRMNNAQKQAWKAYYDKVSADFKQQNLSGNALNEWKFQRYMNDYLCCVKALDRSVGRILEYLDKNGLAENTFVVYSSDQGFYLGEHGWFDKRFMYEESQHMPLMIRYPKLIKPKTDLKEMTMGIDFAPTFLSLAGVPVPSDMQGKSFLPLFNKNKTTTWRKQAYYHYYEKAEHNVMKHFGIRTEHYKLIRFYGEGDFWELFDLKNDIHEMKNIYEKPENKTLIKQLKKQLLEEIRQYKDVEAEKILVKGGV
jgi:choline-sulfatase